MQRFPSGAMLIQLPCWPWMNAQMMVSPLARGYAKASTPTGAGLAKGYSKASPPSWVGCFKHSAGRGWGQGDGRCIAAAGRVWDVKKGGTSENQIEGASGGDGFYHTSIQQDGESCYRGSDFL